MMDFSEYLDLQDEDGAKLVGHRIWLFNVLYEHLFNHRRADQIIECFPTLTMEKVYACLLYYERNKDECRRFIDEEIARREAHRKSDAETHREKAGELRARLASRRRTA